MSEPVTPRAAIEIGVWAIVTVTCAVLGWHLLLRLWAAWLRWLAGHDPDGRPPDER